MKLVALENNEGTFAELKVAWQPAPVHRALMVHNKVHYDLFTHGIDMIDMQAARLLGEEGGKRGGTSCPGIFLFLGESCVETFQLMSLEFPGQTPPGVDICRQPYEFWSKDIIS